MPNISRETLLSRVEEAGRSYEIKYHGCSRCVLKALQDNMGLGNGECIKAATPLAGGVALHGKTCGAALGGLMALGLLVSKEELSDEKALMLSLSLGFRLAKEIEDKFGSLQCDEIQKRTIGRSYNLADPSDSKVFLETGASLKCGDVVANVARLTAAFLLDHVLEKRGIKKK